MVDIYDEIGHIKNVLSQGPSPTKWERDAKLLARFYASEGMKKSEAKQILTKKCETYCKETFNRFRDYKRLNKAIDEAYKMNKQGKPLRAIKELVISKEVLDWFLGLEDNFEISEEQAKEIALNRKVRVKSKPLNFARIRMLFTFYIWTLVQTDYVNVPNVHYLKGNMKRFKLDGDLPTGFSVNKEKNVLRDLGFLYINNKQGIDPVFIKEYDVFQIPITDENRVVITGDDMYNCGIWLEKQKFGYFVCENCGKEFPYKGKGKGEKKRKYCEDCYKILYRKKTPLVSNDKKDRICVDCGKSFTVIKENNWKTIRCLDCREKRRKELQHKAYLKRKEKTELEKISHIDDNND